MRRGLFMVLLMVSLSGAQADDGIYKSVYFNYLQPGIAKGHYVERVRTYFNDWDRNKDGFITDADGKYNGTGNSPFDPAPLTDGKVTWGPVEALASRYFGLIDKDRDGTVSKSELDDYEEAQLAPEIDPRWRIREVECPLPKPNPKAQVFLLSAVELNAVASVQMLDTPISAGLITIAPGERPLYILLATYEPVIWTFKGATSRVQQVVIVSLVTGDDPSDRKVSLPLGGAIGLKKTQVTFFGTENCIKYFTKAPSRESMTEARVIENKIGRHPDVVAAEYKVTGFALPEGRVVGLGLDGRSGSWSNLRTEVGLFNPGGVVPMDPKTIISSQPVQAVTVLPGVLGLRQLVERGKLIPQPGLHTYRVTGEIQLPAGLYGALGSTFIVPKGVPTPKGDPGHSCIMSEDGKWLAGPC